MLVTWYDHSRNSFIAIVIQFQINSSFLDSQSVIFTQLCVWWKANLISHAIMYLMTVYPCEWLNIVKFAFAYFLLGTLPMQAVGREKKTDNF